MTAVVRVEGDRLLIEDGGQLISGRHRSQLAYWGFASAEAPDTLVAHPIDLHATLDKVLSYFDRHCIAHQVSEAAAATRAALEGLRLEVLEAVTKGAQLKDGNLPAPDLGRLLSFVTTNLPRKLKEHQLKAALHLLTVENGANFSVPGSGKTTVVLAVYAWLKSLGEIDALFVVGPPACFAPWKAEYKAVLGVAPKVVLLAGGNVADRKAAYIVSTRDVGDLYLTSFQTLQRDWEQVRRLFSESGTRFFLVVDEAHYIKQIGGAWASAVLAIAKAASRRCVLTGTPFPRTYTDAFNLFDVLWPQGNPLPQAERLRVEHLAQTHQYEEATNLLSERVGPLFYRVRKGDLQLAPQCFHPPVITPMGEYEKHVYDSIVDRIKEAAIGDYLRDVDLLVRLRRGRMTRLRQAVSYPKLLSTAITDYEETLFEDDRSLANIIRHYDDLEVPGKIVALISLLDELRRGGQIKVVVWSTFIGSLKNIQRHLTQGGYGVGLIYGETPIESTSLKEAMSRDNIIAAFIDPDSGLDVLIANPAACAESISLHKTCSHAVYYDLSYNCAQYLQSLDRIHRVGGSEDKEAHYHFLQYSDTVDQDLLANLQAKAQRMSAIIDREYPIYSLDMFGMDEELDAYARLFAK